MIYEELDQYDNDNQTATIPVPQAENTAIDMTPKMQPVEEAPFYERFATGLSVGQKQNTIMLLNNMKLRGVLTADGQQNLDRLNNEIKQDTADGLISKAGEVTGQILGMQKDALPPSIAAAGAAGGTALLLGQLGPQVATPEELVTVPVASSAAFGAMYSSKMVDLGYKMATGEAFSELEKVVDDEGNPLDPELVKTLSYLAGSANASLDLGSLGIALKPFTGSIRRKIIANAVKAVANPTARTAFLAGLKQYGASYGIEVLTEGLQKAINIGSGYAGKSVQQKELASYSVDQLRKDANIVWQEMVSAAKGMWLPAGVSAGGASINHMTAEQREIIEIKAEELLHENGASPEQIQQVLENLTTVELQSMLEGKDEIETAIEDEAEAIEQEEDTAIQAEEETPVAQEEEPTVVPEEEQVAEEAEQPIELDVAPTQELPIAEEPEQVEQAEEIITQPEIETIQQPTWNVSDEFGLEQPITEVDKSVQALDKVIAEDVTENEDFDIWEMQEGKYVNTEPSKPKTPEELQAQLEAVQRTKDKQRTKDILELAKRPGIKTHNPFMATLLRNLSAEALRHYGKQGKAIYDKVVKSDTWAYKKAANAIYRLNNVLKDLSKEDQDNFYLYVKDKKPTQDSAKSAVEEWRKIAEEIATSANEFDVTVKPVEGEERQIRASKTYYPDFVSKEFFDAIGKKDSLLEIIEAIAEKLDVPVGVADKILSQIKENKANIYGHLEKPKVASLPETVMVDGKEIQVYDRNPKQILDGYARDAYVRLGDAKEFGGHNETLHEMLKEAQKEGEDFVEIKELTNRILGQERFNKYMESASLKARAFNNITMLSLAPLRNISDVVKPFVMTNGISGLRGIADQFTSKGKTFSEKAGVSRAEIERYAKETGISTTGVAEWFYEHGFLQSEQFVRGTMVNAAKRYVDMLHKKLQKNPNDEFLIRRLQQFGLDAKDVVNRKLNEEDYLEAATQAVFASQPVSRTDTPHTWKSPVGKAVTQYKVFAHKQARFLSKMVLGEMKKGNLKPMVMLIILSQAVGEPIGDLMALVRGKWSNRRGKFVLNRPSLLTALQEGKVEKIASAMLDNFLVVGGIGLPGDAIMAIAGYKKAEGALKFIAGPIASQFIDFGVATIDDLKTIAPGGRKFQKIGKPSKPGKIQSKLAKKILYLIPWAGPMLSNQLFPSTAQYTQKGMGMTGSLFEGEKSTSRRRKTRRRSSR